MWLCSILLIFLRVSFCLPWSIFHGPRWCLWGWVLFCGVVFLVYLRFLIRSVVPLVGLSLALRWSLLLVLFRVSSVSVGFGFPGFCIFLLFSLFFRFLGVRRRLLWLYFLVWCLVLSTWFPGRGIRLLCCLVSLVGRLRFLLGFLPNLRFCFCFLLFIFILWCWFGFFRVLFPLLGLHQPLLQLGVIPCSLFCSQFLLYSLWLLLVACSSWFLVSLLVWPYFLGSLFSQGLFYYWWVQMLLSYSPGGCLVLFLYFRFRVLFFLFH